MPSVEESQNQVRANLENSNIEHDVILASLQDEIDEHNASQQSRNDSQRYGTQHARHELRFRFKSTERYAQENTRASRRRKREDPEHRSNRRAKRSKEDGSSPSREDSAVHPFPRKPTDPDRSPRVDTTEAFRDALFDALADDEGAAYWESVYSQPIHIYPRPTVETAAGTLEQMTDDEYAAYVQTKMWEKQHPEIVLGRQRKEKQKKEADDARKRQREEYARRKAKAAWEKAEQEGARRFAGIDSDNDEQGDYEYVFDHGGKTGGAAAREPMNTQEKEYSAAWDAYVAAWDQLKRDLLDQRASKNAGTDDPKSLPNRIPWPVLQSKPVIRPNIEDFMRNMPRKDDQTTVQLLKAERVRWHPDKIQQRFRGEVDDGTMKLVTGVFQVVDSLLETARQKVR